VQITRAADWRYTCQLTELHAASRPVSTGNPLDRIRPLVAGNVTLSAFVVGWLTHVFVMVQRRRGGVAYPLFGMEVGMDTPAHPPTAAATALKPGDEVLVRSPEDIYATLKGNKHRGLWFEPDMLKFCHQRYQVQAEVRNLIDIVSGTLLEMKTPAYILRDVHFTGERQLFNSQYEPLFWRSVWLEPAGQKATSDRPSAIPRVVDVDRPIAWAKEPGSSVATMQSRNTMSKTENVFNDDSRTSPNPP
jgi:hypothetical protein